MTLKPQAKLVGCRASLPIQLLGRRWNEFGGQSRSASSAPHLHGDGKADHWREGRRCQNAAQWATSEQPFDTLQHPSGFDHEVLRLPTPHLHPSLQVVQTLSHSKPESGKCSLRSNAEVLQYVESASTRDRSAQIFSAANQDGKLTCNYPHPRMHW